MTRKLYITTANNLSANFTQEHYTFNRFIDYLKDNTTIKTLTGKESDEDIRRIKDTHNFTTSKIDGKSSKDRRIENVKAISMLKLDIDKSDIEETDIKDRLNKLDINYVMYTTFGHKVKGNCYRVVIPLLDDITGTIEEMKAIFKAITISIASELEVIAYLDSQSYVINQVMFCPTYRKGINEGEIISRSKGNYLDITSRINIDDVLTHSVSSEGIEKVEGTGNDFTIDEIIELILKSKQADKFKKLFNGEGLDLENENHSELDLSLCSILAFWTGKDIDKMDKLFRQSKLMRSKWDRKTGQSTYGRDTLLKAISMTTEVYITKDIIFPYLTKKEQPQKRWENLNYLLDESDIKVRYNKVTNKIEIDGLDQSIGYDAMATDIESLCIDADFNINKMQITDYLHRIAMQNKYSPIQDYLLKMKELYKDDKELQQTDFIKELYKTIKVVDDDDFKYELFKKWLIKTVALAFNDDAKNSSDAVLVFQGEQGIGKSRWITSIVPDKSWVGDGLSLDTKDKDSIIKATGFWITELAELENVTTKKEQGSLKAFLTSTTDRYRVPYGRSTEEYPRMTSFYGSVNQAEFLKDDTGNRRYWVFEVEEINFNHSVNIDGLWGQIAYMYLDQKATHWLEKEDIDHVNKMNDKHRIMSSVEQKILESYNWEDIKIDNQEGNLWVWKSSTEINEELCISSTSVGNGREIASAYKNIILSLGYTVKDLDTKNKRFKKMLNGCTVYRLSRFTKWVREVEPKQNNLKAIK